MMTNLLLYYLNNGLQGELRDNRMANVLYEEIRSGDFYKADDKNIIRELTVGKTNFGPVDPLDYDADSFDDLRLLYLGLKNIKKFPEGSNSEYYGIKFCKPDESDKSDKPVNAVFLGSNGVGKTSFYSALEFVGMRKMNTTDIRGFSRLIGSDAEEGKDGFDQSVFLDHYSVSRVSVDKNGKTRIPLDRSSIVVKAVSSGVSVSGNKEFSEYHPIAGDVFYCSEYDVRQLEVCDDYAGFMLAQIGLRDFYHSLQLLYKLGLQARGYKQNVEAKSLFDNNGSEPDYISESDGLKNGHDAGTVHYTDSDNELFWNEYLQTVNYLESVLIRLLEKWRDRIREAITEMLKDYFVTDNDMIEVKLDLKPLLTIKDLDSSADMRGDAGTIRKFVDFSVMIKTSRGNLDTDAREEVSPRAYLNTFKYKLFCVAMKLALCCVAKGIYRINYPLVIDDVFDSSDFDSRIGLRDFIMEMMKQHDKLLQNPEYELQLIFFTQDDLIADQIRRGIVTYAGNGNVLFGHIYDYHEFSPDDDVLSFSYDDDGGNKVECKYISVADMIV